MHLEESPSRKEAILQISTVDSIGWFIWKASNDYVFNNSGLDPMATASKIIHTIPELNSGKLFRLKTITKVCGRQRDGHVAMAAVVLRDH